MRLPFDHSWPLILFALFHPGFLFFFTRSFWQIYKSLPQGGTFKFHLLDLLVGSFGLFPSLYCLAEAAKRNADSNPSVSWEFWVLGFLMLASQACGFIIGRTHHVVPRAHGSPSQWEEAGWILLGVLAGVLLLPISALIFCPILAVLVLAIPLSPIILLVSLIVNFVRKWKY